MQKEDVKKIMHECAEAALSGSWRWSVGGPDEADLTHPIVSIKHMHYVIEEIFNTYAERIEPGSAKDDVYYVHIDECPMGHPAYLVGTFMTLLIAEPEKIWVECYKSYEDNEDRYVKNAASECFLEEMLRRFPELELRTGIPYNEIDRGGIEFVNEHPEITHVVEIGNQNGIYWRIGNYREDVLVHLPTATKVWVGYLSATEIQMDMNLQEFGKRCFLEVFDYDCMYDECVEDAYTAETYVGMDYENSWTWEEYIKDEMRWRDSEMKVVDVLPIYIFGDKKQIEEAKRTCPYPLRPVTKDNFSFNKIFYDFTDLLRKELYLFA